MLFLVDRHSSLLVGICMECIKERYMPVLLSSISLFGKALFYTQFGMASSIFAASAVDVVRFLETGIVSSLFCWKNVKRTFYACSILSNLPLEKCLPVHNKRDGVKMLMKDTPFSRLRTLPQKVRIL